MMSARPRILVAGSINTDLVATMAAAPGPGETVTGTSFAIHGGGKGANQAVSGARCGASGAMLGAIGTDDFGDARLADLRREGIDTRWIQRSTTDPSGVALIFVEERGENRIAYVPGATATVDTDHCLDALTDVRPSILLATNELPLQALGLLFGRARQQKIRTVLNATPDPETVQELLPLIDILIVNAGEASRVLAKGDSLDPVQVMADLGSLGPATVIITLGADGVIGNDGDRPFAHRPPVVTVVDTTGAGDTFCGSFVAALADGDSITEAALFGMRASALAVTKSGAQSSIPTRDEVVSFFGLG
jgi:ribokinase